LILKHESSLPASCRMREDCFGYLLLEIGYSGSTIPDNV
jgi:hypothetical protein